jgi:hypothetical protein
MNTAFFIKNRGLKNEKVYVDCASDDSVNAIRLFQ